MPLRVPAISGRGVRRPQPAGGTRMSIRKIAMVAVVMLSAIALAAPAHAAPALFPKVVLQAVPVAPAPEQPVQRAPVMAVGPRVGFGYGVQVHAPGGDQHVVDLVKGMGFNWLKQQVEWRNYESNQGQRNYGGL